MKKANSQERRGGTTVNQNVISDREFNDRLYRQGLELCDKPCLHGDCFFQAILLAISLHNNDFPSNLTISNLRISAAKWLRANHRATHPDGSCLYQKMDNTRFRSWEEMCRKIETTHEGADTLVHLALSATLSCEFVFFTNRNTAKWVVRMGASLVAYPQHRQVYIAYFDNCHFAGLRQHGNHKCLPFNHLILPWGKNPVMSGNGNETHCQDDNSEGGTMLQFATQQREHREEMAVSVTNLIRRILSHRTHLAAGGAPPSTETTAIGLCPGANDNTREGLSMTNMTLPSDFSHHVAVCKHFRIIDDQDYDDLRIKTDKCLQCLASLKDTKVMEPDIPQDFLQTLSFFRHDMPTLNDSIFFHEHIGGLPKFDFGSS